jgi:DNA-binding XRE family transcriptional regulator
MIVRKAENSARSKVIFARSCEFLEFFPDPRYTRTIMRKEESTESGVGEPSSEVSREAAELGHQVRAARRRLHRDQDEIAFFANVSPRTVFAIEKGKPTVRFDMLARVLAAVGLRLTLESRDAVWRPPADRE